LIINLYSFQSPKIIKDKNIIHRKVTKELSNKLTFNNSNIIHNNLPIGKDLVVSSICRITKAILSKYKIKHFKIILLELKFCGVVKRILPKKSNQNYKKYIFPQIFHLKKIYWI
jgi:hypothetical protein